MQLWKEVDELWANNGLTKDQMLDLDQSNPLLKEIFHQQMAKKGMQVEATEDILIQIFN